MTIEDNYRPRPRLERVINTENRMVTLMKHTDYEV